MEQYVLRGYDWLGAVPAAAAVCDAGSLGLIARNALFDTYLGDDGERLLREALGAALHAETVLAANGRQLLARAGNCMVDGRAVVVFTLMDMTDAAPKHEISVGVVDYAHARNALDEYLSIADAATTVCAVLLPDTDDDRVQKLATLLRSCMRHTDMLARTGGGEFLMIFPECREKIVVSIMESVEEKLDALNDVAGRGNKIRPAYAILEAPPGKFAGGEGLIAAAVANAKKVK